MFFFLDAKNALLLYLFPSLIKPTGRPQQSILTSQMDFVVYSSDVANLNIRKDQPPCLIIRVANDDESTEGDKEDILQILAYGDGNKYICSTIVEAVGVIFKYYWVFGVNYPKSTNNMWMIIQKFFYNMEFDGETISPDARTFLEKLKLQNQYNDNELENA